MEPFAAMHDASCAGATDAFHVIQTNVLAKILHLLCIDFSCFCGGVKLVAACHSGRMSIASLRRARASRRTNMNHICVQAADFLADNAAVRDLSAKVAERLLVRPGSGQSIGRSLDFAHIEMVRAFDEAGRRNGLHSH
jgi:hypothetical protein